MHGFDDYDRAIVFAFPAPLLDLRQDFAADLLRRPVPIRLHQLLQPVEAELAIVTVVRLDDAVRVETEQIARIELRESAVVRRVGRRPEHRTAMLERLK